jgi:hypothetical protein
MGNLAEHGSVGLSFAVTLGVFAAGGVEPPNSLAPAGGPAVLRATLEYRVVQSCHASKADAGAGCTPRSRQLQATETIVLHPVRERSLESREDSRAPLTLSLEARGHDSDNFVALPAGLWRLEWRGYSQQPVFRAASRARLQLHLTVNRGRCDPTAGGCKLQPLPTERRAEIRTD